ncbi:hypothetical protein AGMMS49921_05350 [Endomicrobiia bacterium]|nr:hypothetical protein AGMMS49921_05350 [Endomicrobiia bacterium]
MRFLFSLVLSSCDKKNAMLVNRSRKYVDLNKSVALTPAPQQDEANVDHVNPACKCFVCREWIEISEDFETCTTCGLFHTQCMNE